MADGNITDTAVADPPVADTPGAGTDDLDALLAEFDEGTKGDQPSDQSDPDLKAAELERIAAFNANLNAHTEGLQIDARRAELQSYEQALQLEVDRKDALAAFAEIRGDLPAELFDDPAIRQAWENRATDPKSYQKVVSKLASEFGEKFRHYQSESEIDHAAVAQAVRDSGGKIPAEPPPNFGRMTDREFRQYTRDNFGYE